MASERLKRNRAVLEMLNKLSKKVQRGVIPHLTRDTVLALVECAKNIISRNVAISPSQLRWMRRNEKEVRKFVDNKTPQTRRVKILQKGGFLSAILGPVVKILGGLLGGIGNN